MNLDKTLKVSAILYNEIIAVASLHGSFLKLLSS